MAKRRIYEIAKEKGLSTQDLAERLRAAGVEVTSNLSSVDDEDVARVLAAEASVAPPAKKQEKTSPPAAVASPQTTEAGAPAEAPVAAEAAPIVAEAAPIVAAPVTAEARVVAAPAPVAAPVAAEVAVVAEAPVVAAPAPVAAPAADATVPDRDKRPAGGTTERPAGHTKEERAAGPSPEPGTVAEPAAAHPPQERQRKGLQADQPQAPGRRSQAPEAGSAAPRPPRAVGGAGQSPPRGPRIVATAEELRVQEEAAARNRPPVPARQGPKPRGRGARLDDMPTVVAADVPLRKGVKASGTVRIKGEEPPPAPPKPAPEPSSRPAPRPAGVGRPPAGPGAARTPVAGEAVRPPAGRPSRDAGARGPVPRRKETDDRPSRAARVAPAAQAGSEVEVAAPGAPAAATADRPARVRRGDDHSGRRRVVIDSQAGRKGARVAGPGGRGARTAEAEKAQVRRKAPPGTESPVALPSGATVKDFAEALEIPAGEVIKTMMKMGDMVTITQSLSDEAFLLLAEEFERQIEIKHAEEEEPEQQVDDPADLKDRAPVVTVMGHVDHGKTSLLDAIRETAVAAGEAGGITQHIGAYLVRHKLRDVTFVDTPGHEAFTAMRARGAQVTDVAVIVVAANDGVMPQTIEAINHARAAEVPMLVAINKIDLPDANMDHVKQQLSEQGLIPEEWGGETVMVQVSAKKRINLDELMDMILLVADVQELRANPKAEASGIILEAQLDAGRGPVATMLVQRGTLRVGDAITSGEAHGKVKAMFDFTGAPVKEAGPSIPVQILGFNNAPQAGDVAQVTKDERVARQKAEARSARLRMEHQVSKARLTGATSLDDFYLRLKEGAVKELALVVKGDVMGSVEALEESLNGITHPEVKVRVIHSGVGGINESDIMLAAASHAVVIGFNVRPSAAAKALAEQEGVDIRTYRVIYKALEDVQAALVGMLEPEHVEEETGTAEVRQIFRFSKVGIIAGCYVTSGKLVRNGRARVVRDGKIIHDGTLASLRRFTDDAREVLSGFECGLHFDGFDDLKEGDVIEAYETKEVARTS